ncbi:MAG: hypothetical protein IJL10_01615 [Synergistaceae bacterium]|nr:hypothetical protein [Synergistaceae bacterium]
MKKKIAVAVSLSFFWVNAAFSFGWEDVTRYASDTWDSVTAYVMSWFESEQPPETHDDGKLPANLAGKWNKLTGELNDALTLRDKQETLPASTWIPFAEDKESNGRKINALLDQALEILSEGEAGSARTQAVNLRNRIAILRKELYEIRNQRIDAPENTYLFWRSTKPKIDTRISQIEAEISKSEAELKSLHSNLSSELRKTGLELTDTQADILLNSVTGEDILQNTVIFENVKAVVSKLEELSRNDTNTLDITRRYTGMYLVLNDILIHTQEELVNRMDSSYKPKLKEIISEAESLKKQALSKSNDKTYTSAQRKSFAQNAKSNAMTIEAARLYGELIDSQKRAIMNSIAGLKRNRDLAENTYRTVRSSSELRGLIHSGLNAFDAVGNLSMPELKIFENLEMRAEFDEINRRLRR